MCDLECVLPFRQLEGKGAGKSLLLCIEKMWLFRRGKVVVVMVVTIGDDDKQTSAEIY
jgi:hypothetical protein